MTCDFKPGDEVEKFRKTGPLVDHPLCAPVGARGTVVAVLDGGVGVQVEGWPHGDCRGHIAANWRKVQRRDLTAWLATENTIEEPKRAPAKKRERAQ